MYFSKVSREVLQMMVDGVLPRPALSILLYLYLGLHCRVKTGVVKKLSVTKVASDLRANRRSIYRAAAFLRDKALLVGGDGSVLSGVLPHVIPSEVAPPSEVGLPTNPTEGRALGSVERRQKLQRQVDDTKLRNENGGFDGPENGSAVPDGVSASEFYRSLNKV